MKVKGIILMLHFLHLCSMYDSSKTKTTNGLHAEIPDEIPRKTSENEITLPGLIAIICIVTIVIIALVYCTVKKYCLSNQSASLEVSQTLGGECLPPTNTSTYRVTSQVYPSWAPPAYPTASDISQSAQPDNNDNFLPPRYSSIFDDNGQEIVPVNL